MSGRTHVEIYQDTAGEWRWRLRAANGEIIADSAEGYTRRWSAQRAARRVHPPDLPIHTIHPDDTT